MTRVNLRTKASTMSLEGHGHQFTGGGVDLGNRPGDVEEIGVLELDGSGNDALVGHDGFSRILWMNEDVKRPRR